MLKDQIEKMVNEIDAVNAEYILNSARMEDRMKMAHYYEENNKTGMVGYMVKEMEEFANEFDSRFLTPANVKVGDGVTMHLWSDSQAGTIIKVTKTTVTVQRDHATMDENFKPEFVAGGFAGHCTNQNSQTYSYERNENGATYTFRWSNKFNKFQNKQSGMRLSKGRREFYDYNF